ncbi:ICAM2 protein, partial [Galbula dea]|nr:ICAM2 protein [Galbula dea]
LLNVTTWTSNVLGFYTCGKERKEVSTKVIVYSPLEPPVLEEVPQLAVGQSHFLTCRVAAVAPIRNLTVTLRRGAEVLKVQTFQELRQDEPQAGLVTHGLTAQRQDHG